MDYITNEGFDASHIEATVTVKSFLRPEPVEGQPRPWGFGPRREVTLGFNESFSNDEDLDRALEQFCLTVKAGARR